MNPRRTFQHVRDFQSRSLGRSDTSPRGDSLARLEEGQPCVADDTYAATSWICVSDRRAPKAGIAPPPFVTCETTLSYVGFTASRSGPDLPVDPASESVWQAPHPPSPGTPPCLRPGRPGRLARRRLTWARWARSRLVRRLVGLAHLGEHEHGGHLRDEEDAADRRRRRPSRLAGNPGRERGMTSATTSAKTMNEAATTRSAVS